MNDRSRRAACCLTEAAGVAGVWHMAAAHERRHDMSKYLFESSYVDEGISGLVKEGGTHRRTSVEEMFRSVDGKIESFYFAFGDRDVIIVADLPDNASAAAVALKVNAAGFAHCKTTVLMTPEEVDAAAKMDVQYKPPGSE
jgi:uncharacterized protein with GYD domain